MDYFISDISPQTLRREKDRARELRASRWWKNKVAAGRCHWCGRTFPPEELTMDHVVPIVRGGTSTRGNVVPSCKECNSRKKYLLPMEWEEYQTRWRAGDADGEGQSGDDNSCAD
jgi:5-methylcytosine-specific restriction endonuclease McrA